MTIEHNFSVASNSDSRMEAFFIKTDDNNTVYHTWQIAAGNALSWSHPVALTDGRGGAALSGVLRVEASTDMNGNIRVIAFTSERKFQTCYQTAGYAWHGWQEIVELPPQ